MVLLSVGTAPRTSTCLVLLSTQTSLLRSPPGQPFKRVSEVRLVVLDVGVHDCKGQHVAGLTRDAFRVLNSGWEQPFALFAREDAPVTIGLIKRWVI
jgi:hypothetical protein